MSARRSKASTLAMSTTPRWWPSFARPASSGPCCCSAASNNPSQAPFWLSPGRSGGGPALHSLRHYCLADHHEIFVVGNVHEKQASVGSPRVGLNWHTDHYHLPEPGLFTHPHPIQVPADQGDTRYANGIAAYEALSPEVRAKIDDKKG